VSRAGAREVPAGRIVPTLRMPTPIDRRPSSTLAAKAADRAARLTNPHGHDRTHVLKGGQRLLTVRTNTY